MHESKLELSGAMMTDLKHWKVELLDTRTEKVISGFCVSVKTWADARLVAHALPEIAEDKDMKLMVYSVEVAGVCKEALLC